MDSVTDPKKDKQSSNLDQMISKLMSSNPARPDLMVANFNRHMNECKSIITFLGSFVDYEFVRSEINEHITNLINSNQNE